MTILYLTNIEGFYSHSVEHVKGASIPKNSTTEIPLLPNDSKSPFLLNGSWILLTTQEGLNFKPINKIRIITKMAFRERLKPWWKDYRKAKQDKTTNAINFNGNVDDAIDYFIDQFADLPSMNLDDPSIVTIVNDLVNNIKATTLASKITAAVLLADGTTEEEFK